MSKDGCDLIGSLQEGLESVLGVRDSIGAVIHTVFILTRTWSGKEPGDGVARDDVIKISPTPALKQFSHDLRLVEGGAVKQGDILVKGISKYGYSESIIDGKTSSKRIEKFYLVDDRLYTVINIKENYVTWDVLIRKLSNQTRYGGSLNGK